MLHIMDYLSCQKHPLDDMGYPGYHVTVDGKLWSHKTERFVPLSNTGSVTFRNSEGKVVSVGINLIVRKLWRNYIQWIPQTNRRSLDFIGYSDYEVTRDGRVWSVKNCRWMSQHKDHKGYLRTRLTVNNDGKTKKVHRLVALAFHPNPEDKPTVNHIDGDKTNNFDWNLEWATDKEQAAHAFSLGLRVR